MVGAVLAPSNRVTARPFHKGTTIQLRRPLLGRLFSFLTLWYRLVLNKF
jgi:hypothetical protein